MKKIGKSITACALALVCLSGCTSGGGSSRTKQASADSAEEALVNFLTNLQNGEFDQAKTYLNDENPLLYVFPVEEGQPTPELDAVYRQFREKMTGLKFHVADEGAVGNSMVYIAAEQYNFGTSINTAMLDAMQAQCQEGGSAFADYAGWLSQGISSAEMGEEETVRAMATETRGSYHIDHRSYTDHDFMNLITGGFYDYADFQMAVCTSPIDDIEYTYYLAGLGDNLVACVQEMSEPNEGGELDEEMIAELNDFYIQTAEPVKGYYMGVTMEGDRIVTHVGVDFQTADQNVLVETGMVSGKFRGNTTTSYLSFASTVNGFKEDGMTCVVTPVYQSAE